MRRLSALALGAALLSGLAATGAEAMPLAPLAGPAADGVTLVRDGCGPFAHRNPWGQCRPNGGPRFGPGPYGPGPGYGGRRCFIRDTPYGPRRICRW